MHDIDVRAELHNRLHMTHRRELETTMFVDELAIVGRARVDTAVLNGSFSGYEIKSERDNLARFPNQVQMYSTVLDYCHLVTTPRHLEHAAEFLPDWWGVIIATESEERVLLKRARAPRLNRVIDPWFLSRLLWRDEVLDALEKRQLSTGIRSRPNAVLWDRLATSVSRRTLRTIVRESLKSRSGWRAGVPRSSSGAA